MTLTSTSATAPTRTLITHVRATNPGADVLLLCKTLEALLNVLDGTKPVVKPKISHQANANVRRRAFNRPYPKGTNLTVSYPQKKP